MLSLTKQTSADLPKGVELPLTHIAELHILESKLKEEACYSAMVHLIILNAKHLFCKLLLIKESVSIKDKDSIQMSCENTNVYLIVGKVSGNNWRS